MPALALLVPFQFVRVYGTDWDDGLYTLRNLRYKPDRSAEEDDVLRKLRPLLGKWCTRQRLAAQYHHLRRAKHVSSLMPCCGQRHMTAGWVCTDSTCRQRCWCLSSGQQDG